MNVRRSSTMDPTAPMVSLARSAIEAGHDAQNVKNVRVTARSWGVRDETVLSDVKGDSTKAETWITYWGNTDKMGDWKDEKLGGGTPLICLYLLGWYFGKHPFGLTIATILALFFWIRFVVLSSVDGIDNFLEMWMKMMAVVLISALFFYGRIMKRTPPEMPTEFFHSQDVWVALILETLLANTLTCLLHSLGAGPTDLLISMRGAARFMRYGVFVSPFCAWYFLNRKALDLQAAVLRTQNMSTIGSDRDITIPEGGREDANEVRKCIVEIIRSSRDLRVTGLLKGDLTTLADKLGQDSDEAKCIRFYIHGRERSATFNLIRDFSNGYSYNLNNSDEHEKCIHGWINGWIENTRIGAHEGRWMAFKLLQKNGSGKCKQALRVILNNHTSQESRNWWLCGAIAKACDNGRPRRPAETSDATQNGEMNTPNHQWYALILAVLAADQNPVAIALAMKTEKSKAASDILGKMKTGCENVLRYLRDDEKVYRNREIIFTTAEVPSSPGEGTIPFVKYSAAGVWEAEQSREPVILGKSTFNLLWRDLLASNPGNGPRLSPKEKADILRDSVEWSKKVVIQVDYGHMFDSLGLEATSRVRDAAWRGWLIHTLWVAIVILVHLSFPDFIMDLAVFSICCALAVSSVDQYSHIVFVGFHLWRSPIGKFCLLFPADTSMSDADIDKLARYAYWLATLVVNFGGSWAGSEFPTMSARELLFVFLMLGSIAPGFWYLFVCRFMLSPNAHESYDAVIEYKGRLRSEGYEHRKNPEDFRPLGKDVLKRDMLSD